MATPTQAPLSPQVNRDSQYTRWDDYYMGMDGQYMSRDVTYGGRTYLYIGINNPYMQRDGVDDTVNEEDFYKIDDQDDHFLQNLCFYSNVDNQAKPFPQPPPFFS
jgi:hypothetical protein